MRSPSLKNIAEECGVSTMTVSMALRNNPSISKPRRIEIQTIAKRIGYRPNVIARSLRGGKTNSVGLLCGLGGPHDSIGLVRGISTRLMDNDYACHVADSLADPKIIKQCLTDFCSRNIDGLIIELKKDLSEDKEICGLLREIPNVVIISPEALDSEFDVLVLDHTQAIREIVDHFAATGRKKIIFLTPSENVREEAFIEQLKSHDLNYHDKSIIHFDSYYDRYKVGQSKWDCFVDMLKDNFGDEIPFDALICSTDEGAAAVINYLNQRGYKVPDDIAVSGYNNIDIIPYFRPPLASVDRRNQDVAERVTKMLFNRIADKNLPLQRELIEMNFVHRKSAG